MLADCPSVPRSRSLLPLSFVILVAISAVGVPSAGARPAQDPFEFHFTELAPGVWTGERPDSARIPVMGNTVFVVTEEGVIVFDGGGLPLMAERLLAKIASVTDQPVTHIGISHWHGDHSFGISAILEKFPEAEVVAHSFTRAAMLGSPVAYIDRYPDFLTNYGEKFRVGAEQGLDSEGNELSPIERQRYVETIDHLELMGAEFGRARVTVPTITFEDRLVLHRGERTVEFLFLGAGNTAGDILLWLPQEKIVATGDLVVRPTPYLFNVPPRIWSATLQRVNELGYQMLVPGHGDVQRDTAYVDLLIELADTIADQRDALLAEGRTDDEVLEALDFSGFEERFTGGDPSLADSFEAWAEGPFRAAALKALTGEPMVVIGPRHPEDS